MWFPPVPPPLPPPLDPDPPDGLEHTVLRGEELWIHYPDGRWKLLIWPTPGWKEDDDV